MPRIRSVHWQSKKPIEKFLSRNGQVPETLKQLQEVVENILEHISIGINFLNGIPMAQQLREKNEQMRLHQTENLLHSKRNSH
jgi:hypothetical protein